MPVAQQIGRLGKLYVERQADYLTAATLGATDALRHLDVGTSFNHNRQNSQEKRGSRGIADRFSRHIVAGFDLRSAYLSPSGTRTTAPEADKILENGFGTKTDNSSVDTTVASATSASSFTATSATGIVVGGVICVRRAANASRPEVRRVASVAGAVIGVTPALGGTPAAADTIEGGIVYSPADALPQALTVGRYLPDFTVQLEGVVIDKIGIRFNGNDEAMLRASGPARVQTKPAQAQPGAFTTVGSPVTGILGAFLLNGVAFRITQVDVELTNAAELVNDSLGEDRAEDFYEGERIVTVSVDARLTDDDTLYDLAQAAGDGYISAQCGTAEGRTVAMLMPKCEFDIPDVPDDKGAIRVSYKGLAKETTANDEIFLGFF